ncbi:predicted protein [Postia placenta Mad-698-R]|uniref:Uncharacterized protein n=1 Tax=Postia placenta MAD-698-R-SB12 TaxID=670580 RepID=A0A1X6NEX3_9APHY|nr:hypothetical protein POSPLADRAFT_1130574 [Postia placenta MAD-698-R-SB12]EED82736.1 predicted protein [Postia placenta Mad-698-R]OSX67144.1 hypothetical protein POSPLADRAFT_1130574 [Postia placenta MAD-698-R-SB12]
MSGESITSQRHNDYVGGDASQGRIPGANKATTGHQYASVFPKENRPEEHLPPPTGRDAPPAADVPPQGRNIRQIIPGDQQQNVTSDDRSHLERLTAARTIDAPYPLPPAPGSHTVIDRDPFATPTTAGDTLTGATSADVYNGLGHPGSGMSSAEAHHDGREHRKRQGQGVSTLGSGEIPRE